MFSRGSRPNLGCGWAAAAFANGFGLDLSNAFAGHFENVTDLFERVAVSVTEPVTKLDDLAFAVGQRFQHVADSIAKHFLGRADLGAFGSSVGQQVTELAVFAVADRPVQARSGSGSWSARDEPLRR